MKQFTVPCNFQGQSSPVTFYIGTPEESHHPIAFQSKWIGGRGGTVPQDIMDTLEKLHNLALDNGSNFEELCYYALISSSSSSNINSSDANAYAEEYIKLQKEGKAPTISEKNNEKSTSSKNEPTEDFSNLSDDDLLCEEDNSVKNVTKNDSTSEKMNKKDNNKIDSKQEENQEISNALWDKEDSAFVNEDEKDRDNDDSVYSDEDEDLFG